MEAIEFDHLQGGNGLRFTFGPRHALDHQPISDILADRHVREQRIVLKDRVDVALVRRKAPGSFTENFDLPGSRLFEASDQAQAGRLSRTGRPKHGEELTLFDIERDVIDSPHGAKVT